MTMRSEMSFRDSLRDVDFRAKNFTVYEQRTRGRNGAMVTRRPKSEAGRRHIAASAFLLRRTRDHIVARGVGSLDSKELLFVNSDGKASTTAIGITVFGCPRRS